MKKTFEEYHAENPQVWEGFIKITQETVDKGFKNYSAKGIFEIIRWHTGIRGNDQFKVNNNYTPHYARKAMREYSHLRGFFRTRVSPHE